MVRRVQPLGYVPFRSVTRRIHRVPSKHDRVTPMDPGPAEAGGPGHGDHIYTATHKLYQATLSTPSTGWTIGASHALSLAAPNHPGDLYFIVPSLNPAPFALGGPFNLEVTPDDLFPLVTQLPEVFREPLRDAGRVPRRVMPP